MLSLLRPRRGEPGPDDTQDDYLDEPAFLRRKALLESGEMESGDIGGGIIETHWAAPRPVWSPRLPTREGLWHVRFPGETESIVVRVIARRGLLYFYWSNVDETPVHSVKLEWAGPIPQPMEPKENHRD